MNPEYTAPAALEDMDLRPFSSPEGFFEGLKNRIEALQAGVKQRDDLQIEVSFQTSSGKAVQVGRLIYKDFGLVILQGRDQDGETCEIVTHMHSLQLLVKKTRVSGTTKNKRIGFIVEKG